MGSAAERDVPRGAAVEEALRQSEEMYRSLFMNSVDAIFLTVPDGRILDANPAACQMLGMTREEICLAGRDGTVRQDAALAAALEERARTGRIRAELTLIRKDGTQVPVVMTSVLISGKSDLPMTFVLARDISERKKAEEMLRRSMEDLSHAQTLAHTGSWRLNIRRNELLWSDETYRIFGIPKGTPLKYETFLAAVHPEDRESVDGKWQAALRGEPYAVEHRIVTSEGVKWVREHAELEFDGRGELLGGFGAVQDISALKEAQEELKSSRGQLEERVRERTAELQLRAEQLSRLAAELTLAEQRERLRVAQVLHDGLQQLLIAAKLGLELLSREVGEGLRSNVAEIQELLDESISAARSLTVELNPPILYEAGLPSGLEWLARRKREKYGLALDLDIDGPIQIEREEVKVLLFQATRELLLNVVKHAGVTSARVEMACLDGEHVRVTVSDAGIGFDPEEMWGRASSVAAGFGLFSIRQRLEMLGGRLEIESAPRKGSRFSLIAPIRGEPKQASGSG